MKASATALNALYAETEACPEGEELRKIEKATAKQFRKAKRYKNKANKTKDTKTV